MIGYIIRRLIVAIIVVIGIAAISFAMLHLLAPSPVYAVLGAKAQPAAVACGTCSTATTARRSPSSSPTSATCCTSTSATPTSSARASARCSRRTPGRSAYLTGAALILSLVIAIPLGIAQAVKRNTHRRLHRHVDQLHALLDAVVLPGPDPDPVLRAGPAHLPADGQRHITTTWQAFTHPLQLALPIITLAADQRRLVQPLHALLGARQPRAGLHPPRPRQGPLPAGGAVPPPAAQRLPADDHAGRALDPDPAGRATC